MELRYEVFYHPKVVKEDIPKLDTKAKRIIKKEIEKKLFVDPLLYSRPLRQTLSGYRKLRVGVYRLVFKIIGKKVIILIIAHRREVYLLAGKRT